MSAELNCSACEDIRESAPNFTVNGLGDDECTSLQNNTGLNPTSGHDDCTDLNNLNDCLIGNMAIEVNSYNNCDWKQFAKDFISNLWTTLKAMICSICGLWTNVECLKTKMSLITFVPTVRAFRGGGTGAESVIYKTLQDGEDIGTLTVYMDADEDDTENRKYNGVYGSTPADRDYVAFLTWCADGQDLGDHHTVVTVSVRNDSQSQAYGTRRAQHYSVTGVNHISMNQSGFCYLPKGGHLLIRAHCGATGGGGAKFRLHQFSMVLMPIVNSNVEC